MSTITRRAAPALLALLLIAVSAAAAVDILPLDRVKTGQKGKGRTVFVGGEIAEFDVEILGVLSNVNPKRSIILARLSAPALEHGGVIAGMSGSPVYIDGKIVGAVAYGFPFSKEPIAGITPIGEMLAIPSEPDKASPPSLPSVEIGARLTVDDLVAFGKSALLPGPSFAAEGGTLAQLPVPLLLGGFSPRSLDRARRLFVPLGFQPVLGGGQAEAKSMAAAMTIHEGDAVAVRLVGGDLDVSAIGTVTVVDGDKVLAFGHPLYNLGPVGYGMAKAKVLTVVPTLDNPFKLAVAGSTIGSFIQDRTAGSLGIVGRPPKLVPLNVNLIGEGGALREFKMNVVTDKLLTPLLFNMAIAAVLSGEDRALGDLTVELESDIFLDNGQSIHLEDAFSGNLDATVSDVSGLITAVSYLLTNNEFGEVGLHRVDVNVRAVEQIRRARLERVWLDKYEAAPGETVMIRVFYRGYRGETKVEDVPFTTPQLPAGSEFTLVVGDAAGMAAVESGQYRGQGVQPRSLPQLIRLLGNLRRHNRIYFKILAGKPGLFLRGEELPNLPPSLKSMFASPRASASTPTELNASTLTEYQMPVPFVFEGLAVVPLKIRK